MTATVRFHPAARAKHDAVVDWYEVAEHGIGLRFAWEVAVAIARIGQRLLAYPLWKRGAPHRMAVLAEFPYLVMFMELADGVGVMAIAHAKRKPGYWRARQLGKTV